VPESRTDFPNSPLERPIRVVLFCGPALERGTIRFARMLEDHPEVEFLGGVCQTGGLHLRSQLAHLVRRRGVLAPLVLATQLGRTGLRWLIRPHAAWRERWDARWLRDRLHLTRDLHDPKVLGRLGELAPDLGARFGGPILRREAFALPRFGTLEIHHGQLPEFRGKETTFHALLHGEETAGVTIQRIGAGIDTGLVVRSGEVQARGRSFLRVEADLEELGLDLYLDAVLAVGRGAAEGRAIEGEPGPLYRDPPVGDLARYGRKRGGELIWGGTPESPAARPGVLLLTESYHPMVGGGETQARAVAAALDEAGVPVTVLTRRWDVGQPALGRVDGIPVHRLPPVGPGHLKKWGLVLSARRAIQEHRRTHPVLLVSGFRVLGIPAVRAARRHGLRVILKADSPGEYSGAFFGPGLARFGLSPRFPPARTVVRLRNRLLCQADAFVAVSSALEEEFLAHGVPPGRIHRIPNGVDVRMFRPPEPGERERLRRKLSLPLDATLVVYTGRLVSYKGLPLLLRVWGELAASHPGAHLLLVGEGSQDIHNCEAELRALAGEEVGVPRVHLSGSVDHVGEHLRASDIFVFPSETEAFGLSVVEAMASGLPVVSTRAGGLADFVAPENGALPFEAGSGPALGAALERVLSDPELRRRLGEKGRRTAVDRFGMAAVRDAYLALIEAERHQASLQEAAVRGA
jgi:glycosyltransferase involved in cell wall biosynthesis